MKTAFIQLALQTGWNYAIEAYRDQVSLAQLQLWITQFKHNGGF